MDLLPANLHPRISEVLNRCLQKDQKKRYGGIGEAQYEIERVLGDPGGVFVQPVSAVKAKKKVRVGIPWVAAIAILCLIIAGVGVWYLKPHDSGRVMEFDYDLSENQQFNWNEFGVASLAVSPEGSHFVYGTSDGLYLRFVDQLDARHISGTDEHSVMPFFSPEGNWLGYWANEENKLKKVAISGGTPVPLCDAQNVLYPTWNTDNTIIYGTFSHGIMLISTDGGIPETLIKAENAALFAPQILPDGKSVLYSKLQNNVMMISVHSLESGETKEFFKGEMPRYLPTGHLVYVLDNNLFAVPFDPNTNEVTGDKVPIVDGVGPYSISDEGTLVFIPGTSGAGAPETILVWMDRNGKEDPLGTSPAIYDYPSISPDGTKVALTITSDEREDIWIWDIDRKQRRQLTLDESNEFFPVWTHDSKRIIFGSDRTERDSIFWKAADGTGEIEQLASIPDVSVVPFSISSDGNTLIIGSFEPTRLNNIGMMSMEGDDHTPKLLLQEEYRERSPKISLDGQWLAYQSDELGQDEIFVCSFPDVDKGKWRVSTDGGQWPVWSPDSRELFYRGPGGVWSVPVVEAESAFVWDTPKLLFASRYELWDIHPDNKRFLMLKPFIATEGESTDEAPRKINIFLNFDEVLKDRVQPD